MHEELRARRLKRGRAGPKRDAAFDVGGPGGDGPPPDNGAPMLALLPLAFAAEALPISPDLPANAQSPRWSTDGVKLAFELNYYERKLVELYVAQPGLPGAPRRITPVNRGPSAGTAGFATAGSEIQAHELSWAPPSLGRFVYSTNPVGEDYDLYLDSNSALASAGGADGGPAWSPDGRWIAFTSARSGQGDLYLLDAAAPSTAPRKLSGDPVASELFVSWAPDSKRLCFVGHTQTGDNLYLVDNLDFPAPKAVTAWSHTQTRPRWSPDGSKIAFYSDHSSPGRFDLYVMSVGGTPTLVTNDVVLDGDGPSWTPDSRHLVFVKNDPNNFSPVWAAPVAAPNAARSLGLETVGNGDLDLVRRADGRTWIAVAAQGRQGDAQREFRRIYVLQLPSLPQ